MKLQDIGLKYGTDKATYHKYLDFYQKHLPKPSFAGRLLEIGVYEGASLQMWRDYYPKAEIIGIDNIDKSHLDIDGVTILLRDATNIHEMKELGSFDIIIDDASHYTADQQITFFLLYFNQLNDDGYYVVEDLHTSFMPMYKNTKLDMLQMLDRLNIKAVHYKRDPGGDPDNPDSMTAVIPAGQ